MSDAALCESSTIHMAVEPGERIVFGDTGVEVLLVSKSGRAARLVIRTPRDIPIVRERPDDARTKHAMIPIAKHA